MATFVPVEDVAEFVVVQSLFGENCINVHHIKKEGGWTSATLADMAVVLISSYNDDIYPNLSTDLQAVIIRCRDLTTEAGAIAEVNFPPGSGGDVPVGSLPGQNTLSVSHTTGVAGRSYRGRTSFSGIDEQSVSGNLINQDVVDAMVAACDAMDANITAGGGTWGVVSRYSGYTQSPPKYKKVPTPRAAGIFTDIINNSATRKVGSMDSRGPGNGS